MKRRIQQMSEMLVEFPWMTHQHKIQKQINITQEIFEISK